MKKFLKVVLMLTLVMSLAIPLASCGGSGENKDSKKDETLVVGMEPTFPPFDAQDKKGNFEGFDVDLMNAIAKDQNLKIEFKQFEFDGLIPALNSGNCDIVASGMAIMKERKEKVDFTTGYFNSGLCLAVVQNNNSIKSVDTLTKEHILGAQIGTFGVDTIKKLKENGKIKDAKIYNKVDVAFQDLKNGTIDGIINDVPVTKEYINKQPGKVKIVGKKLNAETYRLAIKKGNKALLDKLNTGLKNIKKKGIFNKLLKKWKLN